MEFPRDEAGIADFVAAFQERMLPKERWTHAAHLLTGAWVVHALGEAAAIARMRTDVKAYNLAVGGQNTATSGYHETVTVFWIKLLARRSRECAGMGRGEFAMAMVGEFAEVRGLLGRYYDFDVVGSEVARREWVAPTLMPLG